MPSKAGATLCTGAKLLQVVATEKLAPFTDGAVAGFVAKIPELVDLACHGRRHPGALVFDAQAQDFGAVHGVELFNGCSSRGIIIRRVCCTTMLPEDACAVHALKPKLNPRGSRALSHKGSLAQLQLSRQWSVGTVRYGEPLRGWFFLLYGICGCFGAVLREQHSESVP